MYWVTVPNRSTPLCQSGTSVKGLGSIKRNVTDYYCMNVLLTQSKLISILFKTVLPRLCNFSFTLLLIHII